MACIVASYQRVGNGLALKTTREGNGLGMKASMVGKGLTLAAYQICRTDTKRAYLKDSNGVFLRDAEGRLLTVKI